MTNDGILADGVQVRRESAPASSRRRAAEGVPYIAMNPEPRTLNPEPYTATAQRSVPATLHPPTVLHLRTVTGRGGGPEKTLLTSQRFIGDDYHLRLAYIRPVDDPLYDMPERAAKAGATLVDIPERHGLDPRTWRRLIDEIKESGPAILHAHDYKTNVLAVLLGRRFRLPVMTTMHGFGSPDSRLKLYLRIERWALRRMQRIVAVSPTLVEYVARLGIPPSKCVLVENAIDCGEFSRRRSTAEAKARLGLPVDRPLIGAVGRLCEEKAFDRLILAVQQFLGPHMVSPGRGTEEGSGSYTQRVPGVQGSGEDNSPLAPREGNPVAPKVRHSIAQGATLRGENPKSKIQNPKSDGPHPSPLPEGEGNDGPMLCIVGEGGARPELERLIARLGLQEHVRLVGYQANTIDWYEAMDVFALSSITEASPNVVLEAMAMEVPVVATRIAGVPRMIEDGVNGLLVEPGDVDGLARALATLLGVEGLEKATGTFCAKHPSGRSGKMYPSPFPAPASACGASGLLRARLASAARTTVETRYSFAVRMEKIRAIYDELLGRTPL